MTGDYTENRILLGNTVEPKTDANLYYSSARLFTRGIGSGGTIRVAPETSNLESSIAFYTSSTFAQAAVEGNYW